METIQEQPNNEKPKGSKLLNSLLILGIGILLLSGGAFLFSKYYMISKVYGNSMSPALNEGQFVLCKKYFDSLNVGDVIVFSKTDDKTCANKDSICVSHRIHSINNQGLIVTKGDNNTRIDYPPILIRDVIAKC